MKSTPNLPQFKNLNCTTRAEEDLPFSENEWLKKRALWMAEFNLKRLAMHERMSKLAMLTIIAAGLCAGVFIWKYPLSIKDNRCFPAKSKKQDMISVASLINTRL